MKKLVIILLLFAATASAGIFLNSFNSGQLSKDLKQRHDLDRTSMGSEELTNILIRPQGMAYKRPGTEYIANAYGKYTKPVAEIPAIPATYTMTYFSESQYIYGVPLNDGTITSFDVGGVARNVGGGIVGLPFAGHPFSVGDTVIISGTSNYDADEVLLAGTTADELQVTATYVAETFDGTETIIKKITDTHSGTGRMAWDSSGNIYYGIDWDAAKGTCIIKITPTGTLVYDFLTWPIPGVSCLSLIITPDDKYLYFLSTGSTTIKFDLATGISEWTVSAAVDYEIAIDEDDNLYVSKGTPGGINKLDADDGTATVLTSMGIPALYPNVLGGLVYDVIVDDDLDIVIGGGYMACLATASEATKATMYNLGVRTLDNSKGATMRLGDTYNSSGITYTRAVGTGHIAVYDGYIYVIVSQDAASTVYKLQWDGATLNSILSFAGPTYGTGLYFDLWNNLVIINQDATGAQTDILYYYDTDGNYINKIINMASTMLITWSSAAGSVWLQGDVVFNGDLGTPGTPGVPGGWSYSGSDSDYKDCIRLIPFEYSVSDAYVLEFGHEYIGFLRTTQ